MASWQQWPLLLQYPHHHCWFHFLPWALGSPWNISVGSQQLADVVYVAGFLQIVDVLQTVVFHHPSSCIQVGTKGFDFKG